MHKYIKTGVLIFISCFVATSIFSQQLNNSPYTRYGLGEVFETGNAAYTGIGGGSVALSPLNQINYANPATYSQVRRYTPILDAGYRINILTNKTSLTEQRNVVTGLRNFGLLLPISPKSGLVLALMPYSTTGYNLQNKQLSGTDSITYSYVGSGSLNKLMLGFGQEIFNKSAVKSLSRLSLGVNAAFLFGTLQRDRYLIFDDNSLYNSRITNKSIVRGFTFDFGAHFTQKVSDKLMFQLGVNYGLGNKVNSLNDFYAYNFKYSSYNVEMEKDTVSFYEDNKGSINLPSSLAIGGAVTFNSKLTVSFQYAAQNWSQYSEVRNAVEITDQNIRNSDKLSAGIEFTPSNDMDSKDVSVLKLATYRLGVHYGHTPFYIGQTHLLDNGINFGISLPLVNSNTWSTVNIGCQVGKLGTINNDLIQQNYFKINLGFSLSTNKKYDKWFYKRLYE